MAQVFGGKLLALYILPQIRRTLVHAYNLGEVDILLAFGYNNVFTADIS